MRLGVFRTFWGCVAIACGQAYEPTGEATGASYVEESAIWRDPSFRTDDGATHIPACWTNAIPTPPTNEDMGDFSQSSTDDVIAKVADNLLKVGSEGSWAKTFSSDRATKNFFAWLFQRKIDETWSIATDKGDGKGPSLIFDWVESNTCAAVAADRPAIRIEFVPRELGEMARALKGPTTKSPNVKLGGLDFDSADVSFASPLTAAARAQALRNAIGEPLVQEIQKNLKRVKGSPATRPTGGRRRSRHLLATDVVHWFIDICMNDEPDWSEACAAERFHVALDFVSGTDPDYRQCENEIVSVVEPVIAKFPIDKIVPSPADFDAARPQVQREYMEWVWGLVGAVVHEIGHSLGLAHEYDRPDVKPLKPQKEERLWWHKDFGPADPESVMGTKCERGKLTEWDKKFALYYYGRPLGCFLSIGNRKGPPCKCADGEGRATIEPSYDGHCPRSPGMEMWRG